MFHEIYKFGKGFHVARITYNLSALCLEVEKNNAFSLCYQNAWNRRYLSFATGFLLEIKPSVIRSKNKVDVFLFTFLIMFNFVTYR